MKRLVGLSVAFLLTLLAGCTQNRMPENLLLPQGTVTEISVSSLPEGYSYHYSDAEAISTIENYFDTLPLISDFPENPNEYVGMTWVVAFTYSDGSQAKLYHFGNLFICGEEGPWYKMEYEDASRFSTVLEQLNSRDDL